ncbi:GTPase [Desulfovermiculus halophilus]|uniref:GTPase n=1 Tax=Desulfovermiculus halophilus TaxID=339722 RepID=UPI000487DE9F|nr:GTPase [Desulfovermiculus halophilus]
MGRESQIRRSLQLKDPAFWAGLKVPELSSEGPELRKLCEQIPKQAQTLAAKLRIPAVWIAFVGGTGTGKSTLYNAFCGRQISRTGVERPKTRGAVIYAHEQTGIEHRLPGFLGPVRRMETEDGTGCSGEGQGLTLALHRDPALESIVLADTPDLDSLVEEHRESALDILRMADVVIFVASQEKYADDVLYSMLLSLRSWGTDLHFVLNKADPPRGMDLAGLLAEVTEALDPEQALLDRELCVALPFIPAGPGAQAGGAHQEFAAAVCRMYAAGLGTERRRTEQHRVWAHLKADLERVQEIAAAEKGEIVAWEERLQGIFEECVHRLLQREEARFQAGQRRTVQEEIRNVFGRYDFLAGPRRVIGTCLRLPLRLAGLSGDSSRGRQKDLDKAKNKGDARPVQEAVDAFNALVLKRCVPQNQSSPAARALRRPELALTPEDVESRFMAVQDRMASWLNARFERMAREAPRGKAWGIYSTSALWGALIVSFETVVGGGLSLVEVVIDSAIAPYVTKGAVELFAYQELRSITRELSDRLEQGITDIVQEQKDRYVQAMRDLGPDEPALEAVRELAGWTEKDATAALSTGPEHR